MELQEVNDKYTYITDKEKFNTSLDIWEILGEDNWKGDCESYCLTLKAKISQFKDWELWYCKINGNGHCILYKNGDVIDCNIKKIIPLEQYYILFKISDLKKYHWFVILSKKLFTRGFLVWKKLSGR